MKKTTSHICVYNRNIGDNALNIAIENLLEDKLTFNHIELLRNKFDDNMIKKINENEIIIFGGGGLIHSYSSSREWIKTGTMWDIDLKNLKNLKPKIILYSVGFNHFFGEKPPTKKMGEFFDILIDKDSLISFRNDGSVDRFLQHFYRFENKILEVPDAGVFYRLKKKNPKSHVVLNIASDRLHFRYNNDITKLMDYINIILNKIDLPIVLVPHTPDDEKLYNKLKFSKKVKIFPYFNKKEDTYKVVQVYVDSLFTISTRGHSQILSIGNNIPTFQISTHPKVESFAKTCGMLEYCHFYNREDKNIGIEKFDNFLKNLNNIENDLIIINKKFDNDIKKINSMI